MGVPRGESHSRSAISFSASPSANPEGTRKRGTMTHRKWLSAVAVVWGVFALGAASPAAAKPESGVLPGTGTAIDWRDGPFTAKDARTLIWRVSRAGHDRQKMNMEKVILTRSGIQIKGRTCDRNDTWLTFWEKARSH